jgi:hypothetical protein
VAAGIESFNNACGYVFCTFPGITETTVSAVVDGNNFLVESCENAATFIRINRHPDRLRRSKIFIIGSIGIFKFKERA